MTYLVEMDPVTGLIDGEAIREKGKELQGAFSAAQPFPFVQIDDFLPEPIADMCLEEIVRGGNAASDFYDRTTERLKREFRPDEMSEGARKLFYSFNSAPFIRLVENITGIKGLIPDPYFLGGGFHETMNGGHLGVHADFNQHLLMKLERRINLLVYLNKDWDADCGGELELWNLDMKSRAHSILPLYNRCVLFNTSSTSWHGVPNPVAHPRGHSRKSIALYYYTATWQDGKFQHTTRFKARPGSEDSNDWKLVARDFLRDCVPPIVRRALSKSS